METQQQQQRPKMDGGLKQLEDFFEKYLHKQAPFQLPEHIKEWIVTYGPWINAILLILALPVILAAFGLSLFAMPFVAIYNPFGSVFGIIHWLIALASFVLEVIALPGLFNRQLKSWYMVYYAVLIGAVGNLLGRDFFGLIIGTAISVYILFQIKEKYH